MDSATGELVLREERQADEDFLQRLFHDVRAPEFLPLSLPADALRSLLAMQWRAQRAGYAHQFPGREPLIVELAGKPVGTFVIERQPDAIHLVDVAILSSARRRGIGTWLLEELGRQADALGQAIHLSVRPENPAVSLYRRMGFFATATTGTQLIMIRFPLTSAASSTPAESLTA